MGAQQSGSPSRMRSSRSDPVDMRHASGTQQILSNFQKRQIKGSWIVAQKRSKQPIGERLFIRIFERHPEIKEVFGWEHIHTRHISNNKDFQRHAKKVQHKLAEIIHNLDHLEDVVYKDLHQLGRTHGQLTMASGQNRRQIIARHWDIFAEAIIKCVTEGQTVAGLIASWRILICWIIGVMREGLMSYNLAQRLAQRRNSASAVDAALVQSQATLLSIGLGKDIRNSLEDNATDDVAKSTLV